MRREAEEPGLVPAVAAGGTLAGFAGITNTGPAWAVAGQLAAPPAGRQLAELAGSGPALGDWFGDSVAVSSTTTVVCAPSLALKASAAYMFMNSGNGWRATELKGPTPSLATASVAVAGKLSPLASGLPPQTRTGRICLLKRPPADAKLPSWHQAPVEVAAKAIRPAICARPPRSESSPRRACRGGRRGGRRTGDHGMTIGPVRIWAVHTMPYCPGHRPRAHGWSAARGRLPWRGGHAGARPPCVTRGIRLR